jgi:hypothetical protein
LVGETDVNVGVQPLIVMLFDAVFVSWCKIQHIINYGPKKDSQHIHKQMLAG